MKKRVLLTPAKALKIAEALEAGMPYAQIAKKYNVSAATIGRTRGVLDGNVSEKNQNIADLLVTARGMEEKPAPTKQAGARKEDTHGLLVELIELEKDLNRLKQKCERIKEML